MNKLTKLLAGTAVGGVLAFGAISPASAEQVEAQADASADTAVADADASADVKVGG